MLYSNLSVSDAGHLSMAGQDVTELAAEFGTPLFIMDENRIRQRCRTYIQSMEAHLPKGSMPFFASKSLSFKGIYKIMAEENMGIDVVSSGELYTAIAAGFPLKNACFHGNNKTEADIRYGITSGIGYFVCDNLEELDAVDAEANRQGVTQKVLLRLAPGIDPHTHAKIATGTVDSKFGAAIETGGAELLVQSAGCKGNLKLMGYHCHIGSQIFEYEPFCDAAIIMLTFLRDMGLKYNFYAPILNLGGGMAVPYVDTEQPIDYANHICQIGQIVDTFCKENHMDAPIIFIEPGRSVVADSALTVYTVGSTKEIPPYKNYVNIDGGMTDNPRYTLYGSAYTILLANRVRDEANFVCTVAGRCCESGDLIQEEVSLPKPNRGDYLAVLTTGAYNYSMASNYNRLPRPPIVMIGEKGAYLSVRRETFEDLISKDL